MPGVVGAAPAIIGKALVSTDRADAFISIKGIDPALEADGHATSGRSMRSGSLTALGDAAADGRPGILLGQGSGRAARRVGSATR